MTTVAVVLGFVALVSIGINLYFNVRLKMEIFESSRQRTLVRKAISESDDWEQKANGWQETSVKLLRQLEAANTKLKKYDRKRDPITGKIIGRNSTK